MTDRTPILVVNTEESAREIISRVVETAGFDAVRLTDHSDLATAVAHSGAGGLVLDLGADNLSVLQDLRSHTEPAAAAARVLVLGSGPAGGRLAWQAGADAFLVRPFHARDLQAALTEALARPDDDRQAHRDAQVAALSNT